MALKVLVQWKKNTIPSWKRCRVGCFEHSQRALAGAERTDMMWSSIVSLSLFFI